MSVIGLWILEIKIPSGVTFSQKDDRLDGLYFKVAGALKYKDLSFVFKVILTSSYGQASVEHGFGLNTHVVKKNTSPETLFPKRVMKDHMILSN